MIITNSIIMVYEMYKPILLLLFFFGNDQAESFDCSESFQLILSEKCELTKNVSFIEISWCMKPKMQKVNSLVYYHQTKNNWFEANKDGCNAIQEFRTCYNIVQVGIFSY